MMTSAEERRERLTTHANRVNQYLEREEGRRRAEDDPNSLESIIRDARRQGVHPLYLMDFRHRPMMAVFKEEDERRQECSQSDSTTEMKAE